LFAKRFNEDKLLRWYRSRTQDRSWNYILPLITGRTILDLGCGLGFDSVIFAKLGYEVVGVDISSVSIKKAKQFADKMRVSNKIIFKVISINHDQLYEKFDIVFGRAILHHLTAYPIKKSVKTIKKLLNKEGNAIFIEPLDKNPFVNINRRLLDPYDRTPTEKPLNLHKTIKTFKAFFKFVKHKELYLLSPITYIFRKIMESSLMFRSSYKVLNKLDESLLTNIQQLQEYAWITIISASNE